MKTLYTFLRSSCIPAVLGCLLLSAHTAHADRVSIAYHAYAGGHTIASGTLVLTGSADPNVPTALDITSVTGDFNGQALSLVPLPVTPDSTHPYTYTSSIAQFMVNNVFYSASTPFDDYGLFVTNGTTNFNFFGDLSQPFNGTLTSDSNAIPTAHLVFNAVPEPGTLSLCGTGVLALVGVARRRRI